MQTKRTTAPDAAAAKGERRLAVVTAYDAGQAAIAEAAGADILLVGDSLGMVVLGLPDTLSVTMEHMLHHVKAVSNGSKSALVLADMPFMSYQADVAEAVRNAGRLIQEGRAQAVKLEGGRAVLAQVEAIVRTGIPVMGHLGLTPQHVASFGGFKAQAKTADAALALLEDAKALAGAGCFGIVLECIPSEVAKAVTEAISIPTIGIGSGAHCDGQVLVFHDLLGLYGQFKPRFVKRYAELGNDAVKALALYADEVRTGAFPGPEHGFDMLPDELEAFLKGRTGN